MPSRFLLSLTVASALTACGAGGNVGPDETSDPSLSTSEHRLVVRPAASTASAALTCNASYGNLSFSGDSGDWVHPGMDMVSAGSWSATWSTPDYVQLEMTPTNASQGLWWTVELSSRELGKPLAKGSYNSAQRAAFAAKGHPGLDISGDGRGCNTVSGSFRIFDIAFDSQGLKRLSARAEQHCEAGKPTLYTWVNFTR